MTSLSQNILDADAQMAAGVRALHNDHGMSVSQIVALLAKQWRAANGSERGLRAGVKSVLRGGPFTTHHLIDAMSEQL